MQWYEAIENNMVRGKIYSHSALTEELRHQRPGMSDSSYHQAIRSLVRDGRLSRCGYDEYTLPEATSIKDYHPVYSELSLDLMDQISRQYPYVKFDLFETVLMNDFLNHLIAQNTILVQVEKDSSIYVFRYLQELGYRNVMYRPDRHEYELYWSKDAIVVTDLISEAPMRTDEPHHIMLEKMLVDMCADRVIVSTYSRAELPDVFAQAQDHYRLDKVRLLRYARRRNREKEIRQYLEEATINAVS